MMPFNPFSVLTSKIFAGTSVALAIAAGVFWIGWTRAANDRDIARGYIAQVRIVLADVGMGKVKPGEEANSVKLLGAQRDTALAERDQARTLVDVQSASIQHLGEERDQALREAEANRKLAEATKKERDAWIARARAASTRTERQSAEQEVAECEAVLDDLREKGF